MAVPEGGDPTRVTGRRVVGGFFENLIDTLVLYLLYSMVGIKVGRGLNGVSPQSMEGANVGAVVAAFLLYVVATKILSLAYLGWTPGMLMVGVRCVKFDGRPPGLVRALSRTVFFQVFAQLFGFLFYFATWLAMTSNKSHKGLHDMVAGTYTIDGIYMGHLLLADSNGGVRVGPRSVTREEAEKYLRQQGAAPGTQIPRQAAGPKSGEPFLDKNLDTYVVWNEKHSAWLAFDKATGGWVQIG